MIGAFYEDVPARAKHRVFLSELARLMILEGLDVDTKIRGGRLTISCRILTPDGKRAGFQHEWSAKEIEAEADPKGAAEMWSGRFRAQLPRPS